MDLIVATIAAGVLGTLVMDALNHVVSRTGLILKIDLRMIGRMSAGWLRGRLRYENPGQIEPHEHERILGYVTHYAIGLVLAAVLVIGWGQFIGGLVPPLWALLYGFATTVASEFFVYPSMGLGVCGRLSPERIKAALSPLANHLFFGIGMALPIACLQNCFSS